MSLEDLLAASDVVSLHVVITSYSIHYTKLYESSGKFLAMAKSAPSNHYSRQFLSGEFHDPEIILKFANEQEMTINR